MFNEIVNIIKSKDLKETNELFNLADEVRKKQMGEGILLRGIIEFSNNCKNTCAYCGLNKNNKNLERYTMTMEEILESVAVVKSYNIKTVVLQSGEEDSIDPEFVSDMVKKIKSIFDMSITLSCGEKDYKTYSQWKNAGADRYLLKIETSNKTLYEKFHKDMSFENRVSCLKMLKELDYEVGSGIIVGLKGQSAEDLANDILFFKNMDFDMIGIGPFIPHPETPLKEEKKGDLDMTLKMIALTRIITLNSHIPATTALGSLEKDYRLDGLKCGANVLMPNFTPIKYKKLYEIYPGKRCITEAQGACANCMEGMAKKVGRRIDYSKGGSLKKEKVKKNA